jgi:pimeloyl-ACP methyl ester carboxylesterase
VAALAVAATTVAPAARAVEPWKTTPMPAPMPAPAEQGRVEVAGASLFYATFGAGEPVILLHSGAGNSEHWANQIPALAGRFRVIVLDSRGHGRSTRDDQPFDYHRMAGDLLALMDQLQLKQASIVGWSDGGIVGLDLAIHHPERVKKLFAFGANYNVSGMRAGGGPHATFASYFDRCAADYRRLSPTPKGYEAFVDALRRMWVSQPDFKPEQLARIQAATVIADGEHDEIIRREHVGKLAELIPGARLLLIPESSHFALWQRPEAFNAALLEFLDGRSH